MNRLIFNFRATVTRVLSGRDFEALMDLGFHVYRKQRLRLQNMNDLPDRSREPEDMMVVARAHDCLRLILDGRKVIVAPNQPDSFDRAHCKVYIRANRDVPGLCETYAGRRVLDVYKLMMFLQARPDGYSVETAEEKLQEAEVFDV